MNISLPEGAKHIMRRLNLSGYRAYIVGGCVRDTLLGREPNDWDIATDAKPDALLKIFPEAKLVGAKFGVVLLNLEIPYEIATYRVESDYNDGRHPESVNFVSDIREDIARRDFTINGLAYAELNSFYTMTSLVDVVKGREDLENKIIRTIGNPLERFSEDYLRMLRAIRFACRLDFYIERDTFEAIQKLAHKIVEISPERIREEFCKMMMTSNPVQAIELLRISGLLKYILPELDLCVGFNQKNPYHLYDVYDHTMVALGELVRIEEGNASLVRRLSSLFHDIGKPYTQTFDDNGVAHYPRHPVKSRELVSGILDRLKFDNDTKRRILALVLYHDYTYHAEQVSVKRVIRRFLSECGEDLFLDFAFIRYCDGFAHHPERRKMIDYIEATEVYKKVKDEEQALKVTDLTINGNDVMQYGFKGPIVGAILKDILDLVAADIIPNEHYALMNLVEFKLDRNDPRRCQLGMKL